MSREKLSVILPTIEKDLELAEKALESVTWADDILVVDSSFSEKVKKLAQKFGARYLVHEYVYSAKQKNWAIPQAKNAWILLIDSDEVVTEKLRETIQQMLAEKDELEEYEGFGIARKHFFFGKFLRWGGRYPLYNVRLFRKTCRYEDRDVHAHIILEKEKVKNIKPKRGDMLHFSDRDFTRLFQIFDRYSTYQANYMKKVKEKGIKVKWLKFFTNFYYFKAVIKDIWFFIPFSPFLRFLYMYVIKLGFLDGRHGFMIASLYAFQDYVSKTKYLIMKEQEVEGRIRFQEQFIKRISWFSNMRERDEEIVFGYYSNFGSSKMINSLQK